MYLFTIHNYVICMTLDNVSPPSQKLRFVVVRMKILVFEDVFSANII